mmetsp:Transcript_983/g.1936  ORF Transcript_983/g.1936 Transcript_983/m.1936 type:complete len:91 (+) Transcript_983:422-694(+)
MIIQAASEHDIQVELAAELMEKKRLRRRRPRNRKGPRQPRAACLHRRSGFPHARESDDPQAHVRNGGEGRTAASRDDRYPVEPPGDIEAP